MKTFAELLTDVYALTNRADLVNETKLAVRAATLKAHHSDYYYRDLAEVGVAFPYTSQQLSIDHTQTLPFYRSLKYIRKIDANNNPLGMLDLITPDSLFDDYNTTRTDVCYVAGANIQINSSTALNKVLLGYYKHPNVTEAGYSSWIADDYEFAITFDAAATVFKTIGYDEQATSYRSMVSDQYQLLKQNCIVANGY